MISQNTSLATTAPTLPTDLTQGQPSLLGWDTRLELRCFDQSLKGDLALKKRARYTVITVLTLGLICAVCLAFKVGLTRMVCGKEEKLKVEELSGMNFEITHLSCDTIAKDEAIRVYAEKNLANAAWFFPSWRGQRTLLFTYDPEKDGSPLPTITRPSPSTILISVPEVSSVSYQNRSWASMSISYDIGRIAYPTAASK